MFLSPPLQFVITKLTTKRELLPRTDIKLQTCTCTTEGEGSTKRRKRQRLSWPLSSLTTLAVPDCCLPHAQSPQGGDTGFLHCYHFFHKVVPTTTVR